MADFLRPGAVKCGLLKADSWAREISDIGSEGIRTGAHTQNTPDLNHA